MLGIYPTNNAAKKVYLLYGRFDYYPSWYFSVDSSSLLIAT